MRTRLLTRSFVAATTLAVTATLSAAPMVATEIRTAAANRTAAGDEALVTALDEVLASSALAGSTTSVQVLDEATGAAVYSRGADQRVVPASNEKLMTSAAALEYLGPDYRFHTTVGYTGALDGTTVDGDLVIKGTGDPTLTEAQFDALAAKIAAAGIATIDGDLVADDSAFDHTPLGFSWTWDDESAAYAAPISALTAAANNLYDTGSVAVTTRPAATAGEPGVPALTPRNSYVKIRNNTVTGAAGSADTVTAERLHGTDTVVLTGSVPLGGTAGTDLVAVEDPTQLAASAFRAALARHQVEVTGRTVAAPATGTVTAVHDLPSMPLSELLVPFLKVSNNGHAELLTKAIGHEATGKAGTWANGLARIRTTLSGLGVNVPALVLQDGSGLSRRDIVTTRQLANLLQNAKDRPWFATWSSALPLAGADGALVGGTLTNRFRGTPAANNLRAKTGTLTSVNALSGYVTDTTGRRFVFAMVSNNATANVAGVLDQAAVKLASAGSAAKLSARTVTPQAPRAVNRAGDDVECSWVQAC